MGKSRSKAEEEQEEIELAENDRIFVPHYEDFTNSVQGSRSNRNCKKKTYAWPQESPPSVLPPSHGSHRFWPSSGEGSSMSSVDNYDQSASVNLHQRLSEFQVALRASERAREEGQRETDSLRVYVGSVEAGAGGLLSRVQELEHLLTLSSVAKNGHDIDQMRGKVATSATHEVRKHATTAAQAVAAAREATMELDKVRRETHALTKAQQEEIERLNVEAAECRILHEARGRQNKDVLDQNDKLVRRLEELTSKLEELQALRKVEHSALQKKYEAVKATARECRTQNTEMKKALELSRSTTHTLQKKMDGLLLERKEAVLENELLEQQVKSLQGQEVSSTIAHYDYELRKVRASLGGEKAQLLVEMASLRSSNQILRDKVADWQSKFKTISQHYSGLEELAHHTEQSSNQESTSKPHEWTYNVRSKSGSSSRNTTQKGGSHAQSTQEREVNHRHSGSNVSSSSSVASPPIKSSKPVCERESHVTEDTYSRGSRRSTSAKAKAEDQICIGPAEQSVNSSHGLSGEDCTSFIGCGSPRPKFKIVQKIESHEVLQDEVGERGNNHLLVAAHSGIMKLKKVGGGEQGEAKDLPRHVEPVGAFGPVMMFLACLLALGTPERA